MSRETIRNRRGQIIGYIEHQSITRRRIARDVHGRIVATYDVRADTTRDARGVLVGHGDFLLGFLDRP